MPDTMWQTPSDAVDGRVPCLRLALGCSAGATLGMGALLAHGGGTHGSAGCDVVTGIAFAAVVLFLAGGALFCLQAVGALVVLAGGVCALTGRVGVFVAEVAFVAVPGHCEEVVGVRLWSWRQVVCGDGWW